MRDALTDGHLFPVDGTQRIAHETAQASHHRERGQAAGMIFGQRHVQQVRPSRTLAGVRVEVQQNRADNREKYAPRMWRTRGAYQLVLGGGRPVSKRIRFARCFVERLVWIEVAHCVANILAIRHEQQSCSSGTSSMHTDARW